MDFALIIPTLNAEVEFSQLLPAIARQDIQPSRWIVVDSSSTDRTVDLAKAAGAEVISIERADFNHGGTRSFAMQHVSECPIVIFLTQDAVPTAANTFRCLLDSFSDPHVVVAYGRQLPRRDAGPIESYARFSNYPDHSSKRGLSDVKQIGFKAAFCSNSFAAYRLDALLAGGGFRTDLIFGEDTVAVANIILGNGHVSYNSDAMVFHSHRYTFIQEFKRYFDIGVLHAREKHLFAKFGSPNSAGREYVLNELRFLKANSPSLIPEAIARTAFKFLGFSLGKREARLPDQWKKRLSMMPSFWR